MNKHTPGPWSWVVLNVSPACQLVGSDGTTILTATANDGCEADDSLIAAAPELLEALLQANVQLDMASECIEAGRLDEARLHVNSMRRQRWAIANKATGAE